MRKLRIDIASLRVETFETAAHGPTQRGTVKAESGHNQGSENIYCISAYPCVPTNEPTGCYTCGTCEDTCSPEGQLCA